jgi:hypothetical protein
MPFLLAALVVWSVYRRLRRSFGRQPLRPVQLSIRITLFLFVGALLLVPVLHANAHSISYIESLMGGLIAGIALAIFGASRTRYLREAGQLFFVPHTYTGLAVSLLFLGRLVYRFVQVYSMQSAAHGDAAALAPPGTTPYTSMVNSPLTFGLFYVLAGYYVCYYGVVLWKSKHLSAEELDIGPASLPQ